MPSPRRRPLVPFALAVLAGAALGPHLPRGLSLTLALAGSAWVLTRRGLPGGRAPALLVGVALAAAGCLAAAASVRASVELPLEVCEIEGELLTEPRPDAYGQSVFTVETPAGHRLDVATPAQITLLPGAHVVLGGRFKVRDRGRPPRFLAAIVRPQRDGGGPWLWVAAAKQHVRGLIRAWVAPRRQPLFFTVLLGDPPALDPALRQSFRRSGAAHLLSLSGLHVGLVAGLVLLLARLLAVAPQHRRWVVGAAILTYLAIAGPRVPTLRASLAGLIFFGVPHRGDAWNRLAAAAIAVLVWDPAALWAVGFQLSFGTVAGLLALAPALDRRLPGPRVARGLVGGSLAAFLVATPLLGVTLGQLPLASVVVGGPAVALFAGTLGLALGGAVLGSWVPAAGCPLGLADLLAAPLVGAIEEAAAWNVDLAVTPPAPAFTLLVVGALALGAVRREAGRSHRALLWGAVAAGAFGLLRGAGGA